MQQTGNREKEQTNIVKKEGRMYSAEEKIDRN